jgi:hypothetical protein
MSKPMAIRNISKHAAKAALIGFALASLTTAWAGEVAGDGAVELAQFGPSGGRRCHPRIVWTSGGAGGQPGPDLLVPGNINCVQAQYGADLEIGVELCDGRPATLRGITVVRESVTEDGRPRTFGANVFFQFVDNEDRRSPRQSIIHNNRIRQISFPPQQVTRVVVGVAGLRTRGYPIFQRICSIGLDFD